MVLLILSRIILSTELNFLFFKYAYIVQLCVCNATSLEMSFFSIYTHF